MYEGYTGFGPNKTPRFKEAKLDEAMHRCNVFAACGLHCGLMKNGKVIFHTNKEDAEYLAYLEELDES
jgi:hypothetical protein